MGNPKQKWTSEEEEALRAGVAKHGAGKWKNIQRDPEFNHLLFSRSNIDLKDKWRNLSVANGQAPRDKSKTQKAKASAADVPAIQFPAAQTSTSIAPSSLDASGDTPMLDASRPFPEGTNASNYNAMIYEALSALKEPNGSECSAIAAFIEQRHEVPQNFRRLLSSRLRRLVHQDKLEKVQNCYRLKQKATESQIHPANPRVSPPKRVPTVHTEATMEEEAATTAAYRIAEAENRSFVADESVKEAERVSHLAEDQGSFCQFILDCVELSTRADILIKT